MIMAAQYHGSFKSHDRYLYVPSCHGLMRNTVKDYRVVVSLSGYSKLLLKHELLLFEMG